MRMLAPWLIWALLLSLLPIVIHLLNRLRYKTVEWAAIMFLIKANQSSTRNARLRHWLILASRCLMIFFFVFLFTRPLVGGWFGSVMAGKPNSILLLLDRSASMETKDPRVQMTKREQAVDLWVRAAEELGGDTRFVLIEHVNREPTSIEGPRALKNLAIAGPTDTACDIPALLRAALDYLQRNPGERAEIWLASDLQESNWHRGSREWTSLVAQYGALSQDVQFRLMALDGKADLNTSVALADLNRINPTELSVSAQFHRTEKADASVRLRSVIDRREIESDIDLENPSYRLPVNLPLDEEKPDGWGYLELPFDQNSADNRCYFVYGGESKLMAAAIAEQPDIGASFRRAVFPDGKTRFCEVKAQGGEADIDLAEQGLILWQGGDTLPERQAALEDFVEAGGILFCFPPGDTRKGLFSVQWDEIVSRVEVPLQIDRYNDIDGPLANTADGDALRVDLMRVRKFQQALTDDRWQELASLDDGSPFLLERGLGQGRIYLCTTLPDDEWSDLGGPKGAVPFVMMIQRMLRTGSARLARVRTATCGEWRPGENEYWEPVDIEDFKESRWTAGVYRSGPRLVALNRPLAEDDPQFIPVEEASTLFGELPVQVLGQEELAPDRKVYTEIWRIFLYLALLFLIFEGFLLLQERKVAPAR